MIWYAACLGSIIISIIVANLYGEESNVFRGVVLGDFMFISMSLYFVIIFILSMRKIHNTLQRTKYAKNYVNEGMMKAQLFVYVTFFAVYLVVHVL